MDEAGEKSPLLDPEQKRLAAENTSPGPLVIHEVVRAEGLQEIKRHFSGLALSAFAAGLSIGFSLIAQGYLRASLPHTPAAHLIAAFGYSLGFLIVVMGRQQLFTETTLTALIPALTRRDLPTFAATIRVWAIVLIFNLLGTYPFAAIAAHPGVFSPDAQAAMLDISTKMLDLPFWQCALRAVAAGWLIGLMVWLLPPAGSSRPFIIILLTYVVAMCEFPHIIAGSVDAAYAVFAHHATVADYATKFLIPTLIGNSFGGMALAALLNHAPIADQLQPDQG